MQMLGNQGGGGDNSGMGNLLGSILGQKGDQGGQSQKPQDVSGYQ